MFKYFMSAFFLVMTTVTPAVASIDQIINDAAAPISAAAAAVIFSKIVIAGQEVPWIILWLLAVGVVTSIYFRFINFRLFPLAIQLLSGKYQSKDREGQISNW